MEGHISCKIVNQVTKSCTKPTRQNPARIRRTQLGKSGNSRVCSMSHSNSSFNLYQSFWMLNTLKRVWELHTSDCNKFRPKPVKVEEMEKSDTQTRTNFRPLQYASSLQPYPTINSYQRWFSSALNFSDTDWVNRIA